MQANTTVIDTSASAAAGASLGQAQHELKEFERLCNVLYTSSQSTQVLHLIRVKLNLGKTRG